MGNVNITIPSPELMDGEYFIVKYRLLGDTTWIDLPNQTNAEFTITDLDVGLYELLIIYVKDVECDPIIYQFEVVDEAKCECPTIEEMYVQSNCDGTGVLVVNFGIEAQNVCGYEITYNIGTSISETIAIEPTDEGFVIPITFIEGEVYGLIIKMICCNGKIVQCFKGKITDIREDCGCKHQPYILPASIIYDSVTNTGVINVDVMNSDPILLPIVINWVQLGVTGLADFGSMEVYPTGIAIDSITYNLPIAPKPYTGVLTYEVEVINSCGTDTQTISVLSCGEEREYHSKTNYPAELSVYVGAGMGLIDFKFWAYNEPDKFIVEFNGAEIGNTGYRGDVSYQVALDNYNTLHGYPLEIIDPADSGNITLIKNTTNEWMTLKVYSPLMNNQWRVKFECNLQ